MVSGTRVRFAGLAAVTAVLARAGLAQDLDNYIEAQRPLALQNILDNIGPDGVEVPSTGAGFVVASPSKQDPDCELPTPHSFKEHLKFGRDI